VSTRIGPPGPWWFSSRQSVGEFELRELEIPGDMDTIHDWVSRDYARYWGMQGMSLARVCAIYVEILAKPHVRALLGTWCAPGARSPAAPAMLAECYLPIHEPFAALYDARTGDRGLHILVAPRPARPIPGFTRAAFAAVLELLFTDPNAERIVVEPDVRNHKIRALNRAFGFREVGEIEIPASATAPAKTAMLSICTRVDLRRALAQQQECP
jgi:hypothetical protein